MAGKFLSVEEAARQLGVTVEQVNQLVDRKKLFPMRDGVTLKFKAEDIERAAQDLGDDASHSDDLSLDLDLPSLDAAEPLDGAESIFSADQPPAQGTSQTLVRGDAGPGPASSPSLPATGGGSVVFGGTDEGGGLDSEELALESILGASSPAQPHGSAAAAASGGMTLELGDLGDLGKGSGGLGSIAGLSGGSGAGAALSGVADSGLSLEGDGMQLSGIDIGGASGLGGDAGGSLAGGSLAGGSLAGGSLVGDAGLGGDDGFDLGSETTDEESASVVIPTEETGDSSFFGAAVDGEGSSFTEDPSLESASVDIESPDFLATEMPFSGLQITGLVCCSLLLLFGGFVMYDLIRTIGSPEGPTLANPLLNAMAETFGWR